MVKRHMPIIVVLKGRNVPIGDLKSIAVGLLRKLAAEIFPIAILHPSGATCIREKGYWINLTKIYNNL